MALTDLLAAIETDAAGELNDARREAERQREEILAEAAASATAHRTAAIAQATRAARVEASGVVSTALSAARADHRRAREEALAAALEACGHELNASRQRPDHSDRTERLLADAVAHVGTVRRVRCHGDDVDLVQHLLAARGLAAVPVDGDLDTGCGVEVVGAGRRVDNTVETRLAAVWPQARSALAARWEALLDRPGDTP